LGIQNIVRAEGFEINRDLHVAFRKNLSELANIFNSGFSGIKSKDTIQKVFAKYQVSDEESLLRRR
jgi:ABC-type amino acid transport substrate-binding protein